MQRTQVQCDKCKTVWWQDEEPKKQLWEVFASHRCILPQTNYEPARYDSHKSHWCRECMQEAGLCKTPNVPKEEQPAQITLEDLLREIAREEAQNVLEGN